MQLSDFRIGRSSRNRNETQQKKNAPRGESDGGARAQFFFFDFRESHFLLDLENDWKLAILIEEDLHPSFFFERK